MVMFPRWAAATWAILSSTSAGAGSNWPASAPGLSLSLKVRYIEYEYPTRTVPIRTRKTSTTMRVVKPVASGPKLGAAPPFAALKYVPTR